MRLAIAFSIFRKEIRETLRDRRTLMMMILFPMIVYPVLILAMSWLQESRRGATEARPSQVAVWGEAPPELLDQLRGKNLELKPWDGIPAGVRQSLTRGAFEPIRILSRKNGPKEEPKETEPDHPLTAAARPLVLDRKADAVLVVWPDLIPSLLSGGRGNITILYDSVRDDSRKANERLLDELTEFRKRVLENREKQRGLADGFTQAVALTSKNVADEKRRAGFGLGSILPLLLIAMSMSGAFYAAIDTTAGEKERGTLQTLLCAPISSNEIISGKFLAVWTVALVSSLVNVLSMAATFSRISRELSAVSISPANYVLAFVMLLPVTMMVTAVFLAVSVFAKDFKDGQNFLAPVYMGMLLPCTVAALPGMELAANTAFIPIVNIALLMKAVLIGEARPDLIFLTLLASATFAALAVLFAARVFERESVLLGGKDSLRGLFGIERRLGARPTPSLAVVVFASALVLAFYGSLMLKGRGLVLSLLLVEYGFFLAPALAVIAAIGFPWRDTLSLRAPSPSALAASVLMGLSGFSVAAALTRLLPPPESLVKALEKVLMFDDRSVPLWLMLFCVALTPALCEEIFFRGLVLSGMRRLGMAPAILATALLFGLAHGSVYRLLPTFFLGLLFGYVVWRSGSIFTGMIAHACNNGLMAVIASNPEWSKAIEAQKLQFLPWSWTLAGAAVLALSLWLLRRPTSNI